MPDRWTTIDALFEAALERPAATRTDWLARVCEDAGVRRDVQRLLVAHERASGILEGPPPVPRALLEREAEGALASDRIGPYRVLRELGRGGMGIVYLARREDAQFIRLVSLKVLRGTLESDGAQQRFAAERQILAVLDHPHVARIYDAGVTEAGRPYFAMEYVEGQPLDAYCDANGLAVDERLRLFLRVCEAVEYAHQNLVVHRDLKPSNILVTPEGRVKLLDFGIAKVLDAEATGLATPPVTRTGARPMTPPYASPEQVRGEAITTASDVYSLGVLLYELVAGGRPYRTDGLPPSDVERVICEDRPVPPSAAASGDRDAAEARSTTPGRLRRRLRGDLDVICMAALRKEPGRRYRSAAALRQDLARHLDGRPIQARPASRAYRARKFVSRHRWGVAMTLLLAALVVGYAATATLQSRRIAAERDRARIEAVKATHVKEFLIRLFGQSYAAKEDTTAAAGSIEAALADGAERVRRDLAGHAEVRAEMLSALAAVHEELGNHAAARALFNDVLQIQRAYPGGPHRAVARTLSSLAAVEQRAERTSRAEALYREALAMQRRLHGDGHVAMAEAQHDLAALLEATGRAAEAAALYARALPVYRRELGGGHGQTARLLTRLAALRCDAGQADALPLYEEALTLERARLGPSHARLDSIRSDLRACRVRLGRSSAGSRLRGRGVVREPVSGVGVATGVPVPGAP